MHEAAGVLRALLENVFALSPITATIAGLKRREARLPGLERVIRFCTGSHEQQHCHRPFRAVERRVVACFVTGQHGDNPILR
jgi:hypothetical protein